MSKIDKEDLREIIRMVSTIMKGAKEEKISFTKYFSHRLATQTRVKILNHTYLMPVDTTRMSSTIINDKEGNVYCYLPNIHGGLIYSKEDLEFIIDYFKEAIEKMDSKEKELAEIKEYLE